MESFSFTTALLLCSLSRISVSSSGSPTVKVQSGDEVTLTCSNISSSPTTTVWFRGINRAKPSCISSMFGSDINALFCDGFKNGFEMSSNISTVFLKIKQVDFSDSGLYFCGFYVNKHIVIANATHLIVQGNSESDGDVELKTESNSESDGDVELKTESNSESDGEVDFKTEKECDGTANLMSVILGGLTVLLIIVVVVLAVKIRKLQTAVNEEPQPERNKNLGSDDLNSAALRFLPDTIRSRKPASERDVETRVVYVASR